MNRYWFIVFLLPIFFSADIFAQEPVVFKGGNIVIGDHVSILEDPTNKLTLNDIRSSDSFVDQGVSIPNLKLSSSDFWLKFSIRNESEQEHLILALEYPMLSTCEFYAMNDGLVQKLSYDTEFANRKYKHQNFLFDVYIRPGTTEAYFLRVRSSEQMVLPLILGTPKTTAENLLTNDLAWGLFMGLILVMIIYNSFIYFSVKDKSYLYYVFYSLFIGLSSITLSGYTYRFILFDYPGLNHLGIIVFPGLAGIAGNLFMMNFLQTRENSPRMHRFIYLSILIYSAAIVLRLLGYDRVSFRAIDFAAVSTVLVTFTVTITLSLEGYRPAKLFLLAFSLFFTGLLLFVLRNLGVVPYNDFTNYTKELGTALDVVLLAFALADKINTFKRDKERSQEQTLQALKENERIIREQNVILETKVNERTLELSEANNELNQTLIDLKEAEGQLVEAEKMASLGQLTAGIAHEINNPINFVTSNITPLNRDVDILIDFIQEMEKIGLSDLPVEEKQRLIEEQKEELDYDYLKIEINQLLKGIKEGASRTSEIVKGLRVFSRLDEDDLKKADLNDGLDSTLIVINNLLSNKIRLEKIYADIPLIECYPGKLNQVFLNILSNGIYAINKKFGDEEGGVLRITTSNSDTKVYVKIEDNGIGMDEATKKKIFEPFFTTKDVGEGTGLGMSIAYNTIRRHQGEIQINSTPGEGSEFILELPIVHENVEEEM
ncbi:7TM diverse intracellular signaling domain-containing protein [Daejeonella sp. JGW-45]|uniref:sensor histidine kinase n=1 Tax=Daejeonella sp. JGW-45 TaxID=3034148 RepID=UPI0023EAAE1F|nr:7TM diverse intracellular signaling domain-containing protein [Daejeonella sp. JGW-45]